MTGLKAMNSVQSGISFICEDKNMKNRLKLFHIVKDGMNDDNSEKCMKMILNMMKSGYGNKVKTEKRL